MAAGRMPRQAHARGVFKADARIIPFSRDLSSARTLFEELGHAGTSAGVEFGTVLAPIVYVASNRT